MIQELNINTDVCVSTADIYTILDSGQSVYFFMVVFSTPPIVSYLVLLLSVHKRYTTKVYFKKYGLDFLLILLYLIGITVIGFTQKGFIADITNYIGE